jgi:flagellar hook protein FlgE
MDSNVDLAKEAVEQIEAKVAFKANAEVIRTADKMTGVLLDMLA